MQDKINSKKCKQKNDVNITWEINLQRLKV